MPDDEEDQSQIGTTKVVKRAPPAESSDAGPAVPGIEGPNYQGFAAVSVHFPGLTA